jgi:arylsulfatase A-like enzyme
VLRRRFTSCLLAAVALVPLACRRDEPVGPPNILIVVWDTVRADRLSLYGHARPTTPLLESFARDARVFEDCVSVASTTVPAHASIFTGLLPAEHGLGNRAGHMDDSFITLAEALRRAGYGTYLFSENPHLRQETGLTQGFEVVEYPWTAAHRKEAGEIIRAKLDREDQSNDLPQKLAAGDLAIWNLVAAAPLPQRALLRWLHREEHRPFFATLNYMEAHQPLIPSRKAREEWMTAEQVTASYRVDRRWNALWDYSFGLREYSESDLELTRLTYDAALLELDQSFASLLDDLRALDLLENTVVVLVGDHGEHLGEKHMFDHQFSVYEPVMRVPLVLWYPPAVRAGREPAPVTNMDLFPTLLELAGVSVPTVSTAVSLLQPAAGRTRVGSYSTVATAILEEARRRTPHFDPTPFQRTLQAIYREPWKLILASDGGRRLYDLAQDPDEEHDLAPLREDVARSLSLELATLIRSVRRPAHASDALQLDPETRARLEALGYLEEHSQGQENPARTP